ncbi:DNA polymerase [Plodia interpunctella granulovirus]|uniref:DNA-directed DNA polymerase n=1 Tax=Plodia interpunctella granulovirus TaxID=262175 RepID=A0A1L5JHH0_9BBAC|nr:DNA polymerase [Plodia interpunctella granulovirus]APO13980.1 DNA polymerase [Plodia interpunctella granulovirus]
MSLKRRPEEAIAASSPSKKVRNEFKICTDVEELLNETRPEADYDSNTVFRITRIKYDAGFLYLFLTGLNNVQFYFRCPCTIVSYKQCRHIFTPCRLKCRAYKSMVVTGLKTKLCHRINIYTIDRALCKSDERYLLDDYFTDENRVQMQLGLFEGMYVKFECGVKVDRNGCGKGVIESVKSVPLEDLKQPIELIVGSFDIETYTNLNTFSNAAVDPIITISYVLRKHHGEMYRYCFINTQGTGYNLDDDVTEQDSYLDGEVTVLPFTNEKKMLESFLKLLFGSNPDDILDYNGDKFDIPYIVQRASVLGIDERFVRRYDLPPAKMNTLQVQTKYGYSFNNHFMKYFNHLDVYQFIMSSFDAGKMENLKLDTTAGYYLKVGKVELSVREMMNLYENRQFAKIIKYNVRDSILPLEMYLKCKMANKLYADASILYLTRDDSTKTIWHKINLALFNRAIINKSEEGHRDEYFFNKFDLKAVMGTKKTVNKIQEGDEIDEDQEGSVVDYSSLNRERVPVHQIPSTATQLCDLKTRMKYTGGKVLSPRPGYYGLTFTLDFSQLYTSIMIHYNTCLSNLFCGSDNKLYLQHDPNAITTKFLQQMADGRAMYKREMKKHTPDSFEYQMYDSWQNATKLVCNSQYGWFGLCCKPLANFITLKGREKLTEAQDLITGLSENEEIKKKWDLTSLKLTVVYGDTDSNFVNIQVEKSDYDRLGVSGLRTLILEDILAPVNATWKGAFKMELENIMRCMMIKGKKAYMCLKEDGQLYKRGFNVKKDVPKFLRTAFDAFIYQVLTEHSLDCVLNALVETLKRKRDEFSPATCEEYSFSQTLNETKNGTDKSAITIAYVLFMQLKNNPNTKYVPSSGDRIPYLLIDEPKKNVRDKVRPTQLFTANHNMNWSKHLGIVCTFLNDMMSMLNNDPLFVYAFEEICSYLQRDQCYDVVFPNLKKMTESRMKTIVCKEINEKVKKNLDTNVFNEMISVGDHKFIHTHEFTMTKTRPKYVVTVKEFSSYCPTCNNRGVSAVDRHCRD